jgi:pilus assembly protein Flp/PilA
MKLMKRLIKKEKGQAMVEYVFLAALIAVVVVAGLLVFGPKVADLYARVPTTF